MIHIFSFEMTSVKLLLNKNRILKNGSYPLVFQLIHRRRKKLIYTPYKLYPEEFDIQKGAIYKARGARYTPREIRVMNREIISQRKNIERCVERLEACGTDYSVDDILMCYKTAQNELRLLRYMDIQIARKNFLGKYGTAAAYRSTKKSIISYLGKNDIFLSELSSVFVRNYVDFLLQRGVRSNTVCFYIRNIKSIYNQAVIDGIRVATESPFKNFHISPRKTIKRALDRMSIRKIYELDLSAKKHVELARDIFLFGFFSRGMPFVDILFLKKKNIQNGVITYSRHKTDQQLRISLTPQLKELISKYENDSEYVFPILRGNDSQKLYRQYRLALERVNRNLKEVARILKIETPLSTYVCRHSWATLAKEAGASVAVISEGLGHTSEKTTRIYLKEFDQSIVDKINALVSTL